jgi:hypothetical protein
MQSNSVALLKIVSKQSCISCEGPSRRVDIPRQQGSLACLVIGATTRQKIDVQCPQLRLEKRLSHGRQGRRRGSAL